MNDTAQLTISFAVPIVMIAAIALPVMLVFRAQRRKLALLKHGALEMARVVSIAQTGVTVNQVPQMRMVLDIEQAGGTPRRVTIKQLVDLGSMPRVGDRVYVVADPARPDRVMLSPSPTGAGIPVEGTQQAADQELIRDIIAMKPDLRERGQPGVAVVVSISPTATTAREIVLDIDEIGVPRRRVTITQIVDGTPPSPGDRVYVMMDPNDPASIALMPDSMTGGQKLSPLANRLDPLVLGPQLLERGAKANGVVLSATEVPLSNPALKRQGVSRWRLVMQVKPSNGSPAYQAELTIALTSPEKAERMAHEGAEVLLRYDPADPRTFAIDSIAMGYGNPYDAAKKLVQPQQPG